MGKTTDLLESKDKQIRAAKVPVVIYGTRINISKPVDKLFPLETAEISQYSVIRLSAVEVWRRKNVTYINF